MMSSIAIGRRFGPYEIRDVLGRGASATVYLGRRADEVDVAVKVLSAFAMGNADFRRAVPREFNALCRIDHPGVIKVHKTGTIADVLFIEMEWIDGPTLDGLLDPGKPLEFRRAASLAASIGDGLQACHDAGVVHRDVKPSNVLLRADDSPVLFDLGLAQDAADPDAEPGRLYATPMTASPEQVMAEGAVDGRADIYALGITLYRMIAGKMPFYGERMEMLRLHAEGEPPAPSSINRSVSPELDALILKAIQKRPEDRYQSAAEMAAAIRELDDEAFTPIKRSWRRR